MDKEIATLEAAKTWTTVPQPQGKNIVGSKWVFRIKRKSDGSIDKYKARLVARGFTQIYGVDYFDTYSPVAKMASFRLILAMAARYDWDVESFDFNGAYLNGTLSDDEEIYMKEPPGYETQGERSVKRLQKSLYGLKQAGRKWYEALSRSLADLGFHTTSADPGIFFAKIGDHILILAIHVDDCVLTGSSPSLITEYKSKFNACYTLTDLGPIHWFLGIKITRDRSAHTISLSQTSYIDSIIARFKLEDAKSFSTPMIPGVNYSCLESPSDATEAARMEKVPYREASGRSHRIRVPSGYVAFEGEWWNLSRRGSVHKHPSMQHLAPGLCLEQTPKPIFGPCYRASRPLLYARPIPFVISLPLSYSSAMSHSPILTIHLTQACPTQMDTRPHYPYHAPLTIIANATHFGTLL
jgi:hypothetical protein